MQYNYGRVFEKLGVPGMGRQGSGWCKLNDKGVMVLMSHANYYHLIDKTWYYIGCGHSELPLSSAPAKRSINMLADYFADNKNIILPVGEFVTDGEYKKKRNYSSIKVRFCYWACLSSRNAVF